ncbi:MAG: insulinase family protein [Clostridiaceae bacterium]|nr:insulinase family protein [Clostridiaceae bacterium]
MSNSNFGPATDNSGFSRRTITDPLTGKTLRILRHESGLVVKLLPRPGFSRRFAAITVPYGSIHTTFNVGNKTIHVPAGTAHFLEHCLFSRDDNGGLLGDLASLGASANAYTSHTHTLYYFATVHHFEQPLALYLQAVFTPYLEQDRIEAERPVILAELDQYQDDPDSRCYNDLLSALYSCHPAREDIGGTPESVRQITDTDLKTVRRYFYQPDQIILTLSGDLDEDRLLALLAGILGERTSRPACSRPRPVFLAEPLLPASSGSNLQMDVKIPSFLVGFKDSSVRPGQELKGRHLVTRQRGVRLYLESVLSPASPLYDRLYGSGLINDSFGFHYSCESNYAFLVCGGESSQPEQAANAVIEGLIDHFSTEPDEHLFDIQKRAAAGNFLRSLDSVEHSGLVEAQCSLYEIDLFDYPKIYDMIDCATARTMASFLENRAGYATSILQPVR